MKILLDTRILLWLARDEKQHFSSQTIQLLDDFSNQLYFSMASLWEVAIKSSLGKPDFYVDTEKLAQGLLNVGCHELPILLPHILKSTSYPYIHKDPFDRLLLAQAETENLFFLTTDNSIQQYEKSFILAAN